MRKTILTLAAVALIGLAAPRAEATGPSVDTAIECVDGKMDVTFYIRNEYLRPMEIVGYGLLAGQPPSLLLGAYDLDYRDAEWHAIIATSGRYTWGINYNEPGSHAQVTSTGDHVLRIDLTSCAAATTTTVAATTTTSSPTASTVSPTTTLLPSSVETVPTITPVANIWPESVAESSSNTLPRTGAADPGLTAVLGVGLMSVGGLLLVAVAVAPRRPRRSR